MQKDPPSEKIPPLIHVVNVVALFLGSVIVLLTAVSQAYQLIVVLPSLGLGVLYWRFRRSPQVVAGYFGLALGLGAWIVLCESLVTVDRILGTEISRQISLKLRPRLQTHILTTIQTAEQIEREACCADPATWHYRPGSIYRTTFDCPTCRTPYELVADETGFLNLPRGLLDNSPSIGLFWAGDSVLQGAGVPSVVEELRRQVPLSMWNLSIQAYGPRQKVSAVLAYALPKHPQWLIVEFYSGNDLPEAIRDDVCVDVRDFRCRYNRPEIHWRLAHHPVYGAIFEASTDVYARLADSCTRNLTLATTRHFFEPPQGRAQTARGAPT